MKYKNVPTVIVNFEFEGDVLCWVEVDFIDHGPVFKNMRIGPEHPCLLDQIIVYLQMFGDDDNNNDLQNWCLGDIFPIKKMNWLKIKMKTNVYSFTKIKMQYSMRNESGLSCFVNK